MITQDQMLKLIMYRGFGYRESEISEKLKISRKTVSNHIQRLKVQSQIMMEDGKTLDQAFYKLALGIDMNNEIKIKPLKAR